VTDIAICFFSSSVAFGAGLINHKHNCIKMANAFLGIGAAWFVVATLDTVSIIFGLGA